MAAIPPIDNLLAPFRGRLKLTISFDNDEERLIFALSDLTGENPVTVGSRKISREKLERKGIDWRETVEGFERQFRETCEEFEEKLKAEVVEKGLTDREFLEYVWSRPEWAETVDKASDALVDDIGRYIATFSYDLLEEFLPAEGTDFYAVFHAEVDIPTLQAHQNSDPNSWWDIPLLQLRVEKDILCLPWWLARTYDKKSLWCCRYALAVSPTLNDTDPPSIVMEKGEGLHILSITRPTFDLQRWLPISKTTAIDASGLISNGVLTWKVLDGVIGEQHLDQSKTDLFDQSRSSPQPFKGVDKDSVRKALGQRKNRPNLVVYQGHWFNYRWENIADDPPFFGLHDGRFGRAKSDERSLLSRGLLPVPLLSLIPENSQHKILIMSACNSGASINQGRVIQKYIQSRSVFIGANYPLLADHSGPSVDALLKAILKNRYLAHAVSEVNCLESDLSMSEPDFREVFQKAGLCLFGDVRTSLRKEFDRKTKDNRARLTMKLTDKWAIELDRLGLRNYEGMTFVTQPEDKPPNWNFRLTGPGPELALVPLVVAINLCDEEDDPYVILGPAFSSTESVALVSKTVTDWAHFNDELARRVQDNKTMLVGLLAKKLTSTYMTEVFLKSRMKRLGKDANGEALTPDALWRKFIHQRYARDAAKLATIDFVGTVDVSLVLNEPVEKLRALGTVLAEDLETHVVDLLGLKGNLLPRGILITKKSYLDAKNEREEILNFCHDFNKTVTEISSAPSPNRADGRPDSFALLTVEHSNAEHLKAIKKFAETDFFKKRDFHWENFFCNPRTTISGTDATRIVRDLNTIQWSEHAIRIVGIDGSGLSSLTGEFIQDLSTSVGKRPLWKLDDLERVFTEKVKELKIANPLKAEILNYLVKEIESQRKTVEKIY